jgi:hypothetical protein
LIIACSGCSGCGAAAVTDKIKRRERTIKLSFCIVVRVGLDCEVGASAVHYHLVVRAIYINREIISAQNSASKFSKYKIINEKYHRGSWGGDIDWELR